MYRQAQQECIMINAELGHVKTIPEFYTEIRKQQEKWLRQDNIQL